MDISFIMPVYDGKDIIKKTLSSFLPFLDEYKGDELVLVIDGQEEEEVFQIASKMIEGRENVILIYPKERLGASKARKIALNKASKDYVGFIDADDCFAPNGVKRLHELIESRPVDVLNFSFFVEKNGKRKKNIFVKSERSLSQEQAFDLLMKDCHIRGFLWTKLYKRSLLSEDYFSFLSGVDVLYEDSLLNLCVFLKAKSFYYVPEPLYVYTKNGNKTAVTRPRKDRSCYHLASFACARLYLEQSQNEELLRIFFKAKTRSYMSLLFDLSQDSKYGLSKIEKKALKEAFKAIFDPCNPLTLDPLYKDRIEWKP